LPNPTIRYLEEARKALSIYQDKAPAIAPTFKAKRRLAASPVTPATQRRELFWFTQHYNSFWHRQFHSVWHTGF
jgi:hypothetical protein